MFSFTYDLSSTQPASEGYVSVMVWTGVILIGVAIGGVLLKRLADKKRGQAMFLQNQDFSRLVYAISHNITGFDFEIWVKELLLSLGVRAQTTPRHNDHGIDVIAYYHGKKIGIQCKKYYMKKGSWVVGEPIVRDLYGVKHADGYDKVMLITTGNFAIQATAWATGKKDLVLVNAKLLERIILNRKIILELME